MSFVEAAVRLLLLDAATSSRSAYGGPYESSLVSAPSFETHAWQAFTTSSASSSAAFLFSFSLSEGCLVLNLLLLLF